jgi:DDE superfamily endonuclease
MVVASASSQKIRRRLRLKFIRRSRKSVQEVYESLGDVDFRKTYRMSYATFTKLASMLEDGIIKSTGAVGNAHHYTNGYISPDVRLAIAIGYFAGGRLYDLMTTYNVGHTDARKSVWDVVQAVNHYCDQLKIEYPTDHDEQRKIAVEFEKKSKAGFKGCAGCIDGVLIWMSCPSKEECEKTGVGAAKYYCARKAKYGLNLQAVCDVKRKFLDLSITQGGASSDYVAFQSSELRQKLDNNLLAPELHLFGDNAYVNERYMATPYTRVKDGPKDDYNYFHSNVRINIECAFGMLVHRWAFLRKAAPMNISVGKLTSLVMCLGKLHNFLIDERESKALALTAQNELDLRFNNAMNVNVRGDNMIPAAFLSGGHHFDDATGEHRRATQCARADIPVGDELPRERMLNYLIENQVGQRPAV